MRRSRRSTEQNLGPARRLLARLGADDGSASIEFLTVGLLLTLPLVWLVLAMAQLQAATLATEGAARQAARVVATAGDQASALDAADAAIVVALDDLGLAPSVVDVSCDPTPDDCTTRGGLVRVAVEVVVPLPLVPPVLDLEIGLSVPISATATQPVSELRR